MSENPQRASVRVYGHRTLLPTPLAGIDLNSGFMPVQRVFYFAGRPDVKRLQASLSAALAQWPDFSGTVVLCDGVLALDRNDSGVLFTVEKYNTPVPTFGIDYPLGLPCTFCDESISQKVNDGAPVFTVKISVYNDDHWVMGTCNSHALCDGSGYWQFMQSWRDAFHDIAPPDINSGFMRYVKPLADKISASVPENMKIPMTPLLQQQMANLATYQTSQVLLPKKYLGQLKNIVNEVLAPDWISTQDVLMALLWQALAVVAIKQKVMDTQDFPLANVINVRSRLGLQHYVGNMVYSVTSCASLREIANAPLAELALRLRKDSQHIDVEAIREYLHFMQHQLNDGHYNAGGYFNHFSSAIAEACVTGSGIMINNWSGFPAYEMDFSGKPLWFDLATIIPMHFVMVMPATDGVVIRFFLPENTLAEIMRTLHVHSMQES